MQQAILPVFRSYVSSSYLSFDRHDVIPDCRPLCSHHNVPVGDREIRTGHRPVGVTSVTGFRWPHRSRPQREQGRDRSSTPHAFLRRSTSPQLGRRSAPGAIRHMCVPGLIRIVRLLRRVHVSTHLPAVSSCPPAHTSEWGKDCPSQRGQEVLDSNGPRCRHTPCNQSCQFEIAKGSREHPLGDAAEVATQLTVSPRFLPQRKQDPWGPSPDKDRRRHFRFGCHFHRAAVARRMELPGVTSVAGFRFRR